MADSSNFARVREAFASNVEQSLRTLGVSVKGSTTKGDWLQIACPLCPDKSGSASISVKSGFLACHQCGSKADLFAWYGKQINIEEPWEICQRLATALNVRVEGAVRVKSKAGKFPEVTLETVADMKQRLVQGEDSQVLRDFLRDRNCWDPETLETLPIGAWGGKIVFLQHDSKGRLGGRARLYEPHPAAGRPRWTWSGTASSGGRTTDFWPYYEAIPKDNKLLLCEGEWDAIAAIKILRLHEKGWTVLTWTGGGGSPIPQDAVHESFRGREVHIVYDNDVFQGIGQPDRAPTDKQAMEMRLRKRNLIDSVAQSFSANGCQVFIRAITIDPLKSWGGDLRDMIAQGLQDIDTLPKYPLGACRTALLEPKRIAFDQVHQHLNQYVEFRCQVAGITDDVTTIPSLTQVTCDMNCKKMCESCKLPEIAPNGIIGWKGREAQLAAALTSRDVTRYIHDNIIGKPGSCRPCILTPVESRPGAKWSAMAREGDENEDSRMVEVLSAANPPLSGELLLRGWLYISANGVTPVLSCDHLEALDKLQIDLEPMRLALLERAPYKAESVKDIDDFLESWHKDVCNNTTHIYGRKDMHIATALTMHSALHIDVLGQRRRGWLDICIMGATRSGKSAMVRSYVKALNLGQHFTPMGNFSRAGLTLGTMSLGGVQKMRPGIFPRNNGKLLVLDEAHLMVQDNVMGGGLFPMLQGARDIGKVEAAKISGSQILPAAVRLIAITNWIKGGKTSYASPAEHLQALYGTPESLSRLDFGIPIDELMAGIGPEAAEHFWTAERQRALAIRSWNMKPEDIVFDEDALALAKDLTERVWKARFSEDLPLYTEKEKIFSVLRIAVAIANLTLSHVDGAIMRCHVREVHVEWAGKWLEHTWSLLEYDSYSQIQMNRMGVKQVWNVEAQLTVGLALVDVTAVRFVLGRLYGVLQKEELRSVIGKNHQDFEPWVMTMIRHGALEILRAQSYSVGFRMTKGAIDIIQRLLMIADEYPETWAKRFSAVSNWMTPNGLVRRADGPENILPIDAPLELFRHDLRQRCAQQREFE
jgi:hypothetical protein